MKIEELEKLVNKHAKNSIKELDIDLQLLNESNGTKLYNKKIRKEVEDKHGVYIWCDTKNNKIVYIGMAGKIKTDGSLSKHSLQQRLIASRGKDKTTKKDISTAVFVKNFITKANIDSLKYYVFYINDNTPASYIESILLYEYYKKKDNKLPELNNSF